MATIGTQRHPSDQPFHAAMGALMDELGLGDGRGRKGGLPGLNELARRADVSHSYLSNLTRPPTHRRHQPITGKNIDTIERIAAALDGRAHEIGRPPVAPEHFREFREHVLRQALEARVDDLALADVFEGSRAALIALVNEFSKE